jgi:LysR family transcriptional regulator, glycine cleavage system transcriptional activator
MRRLPPLHDLLAFEAAARLMSFLKASEELHVTQSAISHRIKSLEEFLGRELFIRINRNIALSRYGSAYLPEVREILTRLESATERLKAEPRARVRISAAPALGARWLVGKLGGFQRQHPEIELQVSSSYDLTVIARNETDIGIRYGLEDTGGLNTVRLIDETLFPVASPAWLKAHGPIRRAADLLNATRYRHPLLDWATWFSAAGVHDTVPDEGALFEDAMLMYEAVAAGGGVALTLRTLFESYNASGSLVKAFDHEMPDRAYTVVIAPAAAGNPEVERFVEWLVMEARSR